MLVSIKSALRNVGERFQSIDFDGIQKIVDTFSDSTRRDAAIADPQDYMINEMRKNNLEIPEGLHFHFRQGTTLVPPEPDDIIAPPSRLVLAAAPNKPLELELLQTGGAEILAGVAFPCRGCHICIIVIPEM